MSHAYRDYVLEQLETLGPVSARSMFGGVGLYHGDVFFGIVYDDTLFLKTDEESRREYEAAGMGPFRPYADKPTTFRYHQVPPDVLEDADRLVAWARRAVQIASAAAEPKRRKRR